MPYTTTMITMINGSIVIVYIVVAVGLVLVGLVIVVILGVLVSFLLLRLWMDSDAFCKSSSCA